MGRIHSTAHWTSYDKDSWKLKLMVRSSCLFQSDLSLVNFAQVLSLMYAFIFSLRMMFSCKEPKGC